MGRIAAETGICFSYPMTTPIIGGKVFYFLGSHFQGKRKEERFTFPETIWYIELQVVIKLERKKEFVLSNNVFVRRKKRF
jgi:hypothetical protein